MQKEKNSLAAENTKKRSALGISGVVAMVFATVLILKHRYSAEE